MATVETSPSWRSHRSPLYAVLFAAMSAMAAGDRPPEGKAGPPEISTAQEEPASGQSEGSATTGVRPPDTPASVPATRTSRPTRYGTGYEARRGPGGGGGGGRGGRR